MTASKTKTRKNGKRAPVKPPFNMTQKKRLRLKGLAISLLSFLIVGYIWDTSGLTAAVLSKALYIIGYLAATNE